jgi:hypothetical protein
MNKFEQEIKNNLSDYKGIISDQSIIDEVNDVLVYLENHGFHKLINNFLSHKKTLQAYTFLYECYICYHLSKNTEINNLVYEPNDSVYPPDFRFNIETITYDLQVKMLTNIDKNQIRLLFSKECQNRLYAIEKPLFFNYALSPSFLPEHINTFFEYIVNNLDSFPVLPSLDSAFSAEKLYWGDESENLVEFSFAYRSADDTRKSIVVGYSKDSMGNEFRRREIDEYRKKVKSILDKSKKTFANHASDTQANLVVIGYAPGIDIHDDIWMDIFYGDEGFMVSQTCLHEKSESVRANNGLLREDTFSNITSIVCTNRNFSAEQLEGNYYPHLIHLESIKKYPKVFSNFKYGILNKWGKYTLTNKDV